MNRKWVFQLHNEPNGSMQEVAHSLLLVEFAARNAIVFLDLPARDLSRPVGFTLFKSDFHKGLAFE